VSDHQADYPIATMCQLLGVSPSGYYAWRKRQPSPRSETDVALIAEIQVAHAGSRGTYGAPRIHAELAGKGTYIGRKRVARLMTQAGLAGVSRRRFVTTTVKDGGRQAPDLVERNFTAEAPDRLWVADITYIPTWTGFLYLAVVLDAYSRRIVGWSMATTLAKQLVLDALNMALAARRPRGVIHHSDQGSQYTSIEFGQHCRKQACVPRWVRSATPMTTPCARASLPLSNASFSRGIASGRSSRREAQSSTSSRGSTIRAAATPRSDIFPRWTLSNGVRRQRLIPTHVSLPPCSRPSRTSPPGGPKKGPSLTASARDGRTIVRVGTEEWLRRGPNQRMPPNRRTR
jgi:putative transposase